MAQIFVSYEKFSYRHIARNCWSPNCIVTKLGIFPNAGRKTDDHFFVEAAHLLRDWHVLSNHHTSFLWSPHDNCAIPDSMNDRINEELLSLI